MKAHSYSILSGVVFTTLWFCFGVAAQDIEHRRTAEARVDFGFPEFTQMTADESFAVPLPVEIPARDTTYGRQALVFERNDGQVNADVKYLARGSGYILFLTSSEAVMVLSAARRSENAERLGLRNPNLDGEAAVPQESPAPVHVFRMRIVGANSSPSLRAEEQLQTRVNSFIGNDPSHWRTNVPTFGHVRYEEVYPGIDLVYYGNREGMVSTPSQTSGTRWNASMPTAGELEYDFVVAPGADPNRITLAIEGADKMQLDEHGDLLLSVGEQQLRWRKPIIYQAVDGMRREISGQYTLSGSGGPSRAQNVRFELAAYDPTQPLVIDPALVYGTFLGGTAAANGNGTSGGGIAVDRDGNVFVTGSTSSADFPTRNPAQAKLSGTGNFFVTKLDSTGQILYSTYVGGSSGFSPPPRVASDFNGSAYVAGWTGATDFPLVNAVQPKYAGGTSDAIVFKLNPEGSALLYSTYLGGRGDESNTRIAVDTAGSVVLSGLTASADFPTANALQARLRGETDAYVAKLNPGGTALIYSTYLGGNNRDYARTLAVDAEGSAYLGGVTLSSDFPTNAPLQPKLNSEVDGFFAKINPTGDTLLLSSYFGGAGNDSIQGIAIGSDGDIYFAATEASEDFSTLDDVIVARYNPASNKLVFSTSLGGSAREFPESLALDGAGNAYVGGYTTSRDFPTLDALQTSYGGGDRQGFLSGIGADGKVIYSSFLGGSGSAAITGIALDPINNIYVAGTASSDDFPINNPILPKNPASSAAFVAKFSPVGTLPPLKVIRSGDTLLITWPASVTGAVLEFTDSLPTSSWTPVPVPPVIVGDQNAVTVDIGGSEQFFRLRKS